MGKFSSIQKTLSGIYPPCLCLLVFFPLFLGFFIDYELSDSRYIAINLVWIPVFTIPYIYFQKKIIFRSAVILYFFIGLIETSHWMLIKGPLTLSSLLVISNTNFVETIDFFDLKASAELAILFPYTLLFLFCIRNPPLVRHSEIKPVIVAIVIISSSLFILENSINGRFIRKATPQIVKVTSSFFVQRKLYCDAMKKALPGNIESRAGFDNQPQTFILILGESCSRRHMSIYGASRKTNPKLESRKDIIAYNNAVSFSSNTINSLLSMLTNSSLEGKADSENYIDILDVFHSAGFTTYWISNQSPIGVWDNLVTQFAQKSDYFKVVNTSSNTSFEATLAVSYDSKLFKPYLSVLKDTTAKKFIVLHLMGSHSSYSKRYPYSFDVFSGNNSREKTIAAYDNSILYNDYIVDSLLNITNAIVAQNNQIASAIYISDHGENVFDESEKVGHDYAGNLPEANVEVPFLVWLSPEFITLDPAKTSSVYAGINKPFVSNNLFHSIINLCGIQSPFLDETRSVFHEKFNEKRPRILEDGRDYDQ